MADLLTVLITAAIAFPLVVPQVLAFFPRVDLAVMNALMRWGFQALGWGLPGLAAVAGWVLRNVCSAQAGAVLGLSLRSQVAADRGRTPAAVRSAEAMLHKLRALAPSVCSWGLLNTAIDVFVNAGLYRRAVDLAADWTSEAQDAGREAEPGSHAIAQINRAEALHNLGRNTEALQLLETLDDGCRKEPVALQGRAVLRAWILVHMNRADEAAVVMDSVDPTPFGRRYQAEVFYTQSAIARERGDPEEAIQIGRLGLTAARRASSRRNGLVIVAAAEFTSGNVDGALALLVTAAGQRYQGQAARGLLLQGLCCERQGRGVEASKCYASALALDPESYLCEEIRDRQSRLAEWPSADR